MTEIITLSKNPKIEFHLDEDGFQLYNEQMENVSSFHYYSDVQSLELNNTWFPLVAKWLRPISWIANGVPLFPKADSYKKSSLIIHFKESKAGIWLSTARMAKKAKLLKSLLDEKMVENGV